jgi:glycogen operon protein
VKNFLTVTLLSIGMPMILMGDEVRRSQGGNNNAYCQDNEISWFDWSLVDRHADVHRFVTMLIERRQGRKTGQGPEAVTLDELLRRAGKAWHGVGLGRPDWGEHSSSLAFEAEFPREALRLYLIMNAWSQPLEFELPTIAGGTASWRRWIDTARGSPDDIVHWETAPILSQQRYPAAAHSVVVLMSEVGRTG